MPSLAMQHELALAAFFFVVWLAEVFASRVLKTSPLLGQVVAGVVMGPPLLDVVPANSVEALQLLGKLGVYLLVIESGLSVDIAAVRAVGLRAATAAAAGVAGPVLLTFAVLGGVYGVQWQVWLAAGAALAPTSLGFSAKLLAESNLLTTPFGLTTSTAAVVDDVLSIVLLAEVQALSKDDASTWDYLRPLVASFACVAIGSGVAWVLSARFEAFERRLPEASAPTLLVVGVMATAAAFAAACSAVDSSDILGCFLAGLLFSRSRVLPVVWTSQLKRLSRWGTALFFACTIGFSVPQVSDLFIASALARGGLLTVAATLGKCVVGFFAVPLNAIEFGTFAAAMNGRGEFSFLIQTESFEDGTLSTTVSAGVVWALLVSSLLAPVAFRLLVRRRPLPTGQPQPVSVITPGHTPALPATSTDAVSVDAVKLDSGAATPVPESV